MKTINYHGELESTPISIINYYDGEITISIGDILIDPNNVATVKLDFETARYFLKELNKEIREGESWQKKLNNMINETK